MAGWLFVLCTDKHKFLGLSFLVSGPVGWATLAAYHEKDNQAMPDSRPQTR